MSDKGLTIKETIRSHGISVAGIAMLLQIAKHLESGDVSISGAARDDTLYWLSEWRKAGGKDAD